MQNLIFLLWVLVFPGIVFADQKPWEKEPLIPPPKEIRSVEAQPNRMLAVTYANGRTFIFEIKETKPRFDCNEVQINQMGEIVIIPRSQSNSYQYVLGEPILFSRWLPFSGSQ